MTQTWLGADPVARDNESYEAVSCLACSKQHFICLASGHVLGEDEARPSSRRVPDFQPKQIRRLHERSNAPIPSDRIAGEAGGAVRTTTALPKAS